MKKIYIDKETGKRKVVTINDLPSKTDKSWKDACDASKIVHRMQQTGICSHLAAGQGNYLDVSEVPDLIGALNQVQSATNAFMSLPAKIRARFENNMVKYVEFLQDPANVEEAIELGLMEVTKKADKGPGGQDVKVKKGDSVSTKSNPPSGSDSPTGGKLNPKD
jgi:phage internal scaffolding protein